MIFNNTENYKSVFAGLFSSCFRKHYRIRYLDTDNELFTILIGSQCKVNYILITCILYN